MGPPNVCSASGESSCSTSAGVFSGHNRHPLRLLSPGHQVLHHHRASLGLHGGEVPREFDREYEARSSLASVVTERPLGSGPQDDVLLVLQAGSAGSTRCARPHCLRLWREHPRQGTGDSLRNPMKALPRLNPQLTLRV